MLSKQGIESQQQTGKESQQTTENTPNLGDQSRGNSLKRDDIRYLNLEPINRNRTGEIASEQPNILFIHGDLAKSGRKVR